MHSLGEEVSFSMTKVSPLYNQATGKLKLRSLANEEKQFSLVNILVNVAGGDRIRKTY